MCTTFVALSLAGQWGGGLVPALIFLGAIVPRPFAIEGLKLDLPDAPFKPVLMNPHLLVTLLTPGSVA